MRVGGVASFQRYIYIHKKILWMFVCDGDGHYFINVKKSIRGLKCHAAT